MALPAPNNNVNALDKLQREVIPQAVQAVQGGQPVNPDGTPCRTPEEIAAYYKRLQEEGVQFEQLGEKFEDAAKHQHDLTQDMAKAVAKRVVFNLKTAQQAQPDVFQGNMAAPGSFSPTQESGPMPMGLGGMGAEAQPQPEDDPFAAPVSIENMQFTSVDEVRQALDSIGNPSDAIDLFSERFGNENAYIEDPDSPGRTSENLTAIKEPIMDYFSSPDEKTKDQAAAFLLHNVITDGSKPDKGESNMIPTNHVKDIQPHVASLVKETNELIKKLAQEAANSKKYSGAFNLQKEAQHKSLQNVIQWGPDQVHYDIFTRQPISSWHLVERNKGFGLKIDDILDIDFEAIWRGTIMDKYSQPFRDKDGNWKGGYIENRFEVDRNVPELNNMQLKPGEKRKPTLPEYGHTQARLEAARAELNKDRGYDPAEKGQPYNWAKEASVKKKVTAQLHPNSGPQPYDGLQPMKMPGEKTLNTNPHVICQCGASLKKGETTCQRCGRINTNPIYAPPVTGPQKKKPETKTDTVSIPKNTKLNSAQPDLTTGGIFYDGNKFYVYASHKKHHFDTYEKAEEFQQMPAVDPSNSGAIAVEPTENNQLQLMATDEADIPVDPTRPLHPKKLDIHNSAQGLALEG